MPTRSITGINPLTAGGEAGEKAKESIVPIDRDVLACTTRTPKTPPNSREWCNSKCICHMESTRPIKHSLWRQWIWRGKDSIPCNIRIFPTSIIGNCLTITTTVGHTGLAWRMSTQAWQISSPKWGTSSKPQGVSLWVAPQEPPTRFCRACSKTIAGG